MLVMNTSSIVGVLLWFASKDPNKYTDGSKQHQNKAGNILWGLYSTQCELCGGLRFLGIVIYTFNNTLTFVSVFTVGFIMLMIVYDSALWMMEAGCCHTHAVLSSV